MSKMYLRLKCRGGMFAEVIEVSAPRRQGGRKVAASLSLVAAAAVISPAAKNPTLAASIKIQMLFSLAGAVRLREHSRGTLPI